MTAILRAYTPVGAEAAECFCVPEPVGRHINANRHFRITGWLHTHDCPVTLNARLEEQLGDALRRHDPPPLTPPFGGSDA